MKLLVKNKSIAVPGEELAHGLEYLPANHTYRNGDKIIASRLGLVNIDGRLIKIIPVSGKYIPQRGDLIIAKVEDVTLNGWLCSINSAYSSLLSIREGSPDFIPKGADLTRYYSFGDYLMVEVIGVSSQNVTDLTMKGQGLKRLGNGRILLIDSNKIPRLIGKAASMINLLKDATGCRISAGQNGVVWVQGTPENELVAVEAIRKIEAESHISGLTDRIKAFLDEQIKKSD